MGQPMPLAMIRPGEVVTIVDISAGWGLTRRLADMGLIPGMTLRVINNQMPGPIIVEVRGSRLIFGYGIAQKILVEV